MVNANELYDQLMVLNASNEIINDFLGKKFSNIRLRSLLDCIRNNEEALKYTTDELPEEFKVYFQNKLIPKKRKSTEVDENQEDDKSSPELNSFNTKTLIFKKCKTSEEMKKVLDSCMASVRAMEKEHERAEQNEKIINHFDTNPIARQIFFQECVICRESKQDATSIVGTDFETHFKINPKLKFHGDCYYTNCKCTVPVKFHYSCLKQFLKSSKTVKCPHCTEGITNTPYTETFNDSSDDDDEADDADTADEAVGLNNGATAAAIAQNDGMDDN
jgi:hypothetical protein